MVCCRRVASCRPSASSASLFATTRITLREALIQLESQGLIYREERRGWFVSPERLAYNPLVRSHFHAMVSEQGRVPATEVLSARQMPASAAVCEPLARRRCPASTRSAGRGGWTGGWCCMSSTT